MLFRTHGGQLRMSDALTLGISRYRLYQLRDEGIIEVVSRGIYRLTELPTISNPDLVTIALRYPNAVICLVSALAWHEMTTQIPHAVTVAVPPNTRLPVLDYPPIKAYRFATPAFNAGVEKINIDSITIRIYNAEKTLVDCFKFRNKIGMDVVIEALQLYRRRKHLNLPALLRYASICRVEKVMRPYLEAIL
ncbi:type IV toxin-antitoxin system AbiEi family antitoxin domain-containing protein [Thiothrix lacustris]|jgi:predicted transcriptional regulator of viral defense system|uniref:type IV toxin-antitoxin system AbiEi family antitoxin domain-containing protein n=1 Tax=Thiothrix lacustris TaxID=525917 RepID=UPI000685ACF7|nr:type IV toxin-antitoxin system AbiEi family antitoxin domain-containing protein [Thiothrix lacustris]WMP16248.1 type IV toxin-antitoxin system AbiEi family antitoxin domain-containing protein [Thiothrix lacustris]